MLLDQLGIHTRGKRCLRDVIRDLAQIRWYAVVGGEISIDIYELGKDKGQIVKDIKGKFEFFGDRLKPGGNDFPIEQQIIAQKRKGCKTHHVESWRDTERLLHLLT